MVSLEFLDLEAPYKPRILKIPELLIPKSTHSLGCTEQIPLFPRHQSRLQGWDTGQLLRVGLRRISGFLGVGLFVGPFLPGISQDFMDVPEMARKPRLPNLGHPYPTGRFQSPGIVPLEPKLFLFLPVQIFP